MAGGSAAASSGQPRSSDSATSVVKAPLLLELWSASGFRTVSGSPWRQQPACPGSRGAVCARLCTAASQSHRERSKLLSTTAWSEWSLQPAVSRADRDWATSPTSSARSMEASSVRNERHLRNALPRACRSGTPWPTRNLMEVTHAQRGKSGSRHLEGAGLTVPRDICYLA